MAQEMMSARLPSWTVGRSQTQDGVDCRRGTPEVGSLVTLASQMRRPRPRGGVAYSRWRGEWCRAGISQAVSPETGGDWLGGLPGRSAGYTYILNSVSDL